MKLKQVTIASTLAAIVCAGIGVYAAGSNNNSKMTEANKKAIEQVVHHYLVNHPEVLVEASQALQKQQDQQMQASAKTAIIENAPKLFAEGISVAGNRKGGVTLVEFFDYQCSHCKQMGPVIDGLLQKDKNLRVIYKEFPIFGESSELAARAALAAAKQDKYLAMHEALLKHDKRLNAEVIDSIAKSIGLDVEKLQADMKSEEVTAELTAARQMAEKLKLMGTPAIIIAATPNSELKKDSEPTFIPGGASEKTLTDLIKKVSST